MSPSSLIVDRRFRGVGRIKKASGTTSKAVLRRLNRMLTALFDEGRLDLLRAVRDGQITPLALLDAYQRKSLDRLPTAGLAKPLASAWLEWVLARDYSIEHKRSLVQSLRHLLNAKVASPFDGTSLDELTKGLPRKSVGDIPALLAAARKRLKDHPRSFSLARSACQAFAREHFKRSSALWRDISDVEPMTTKPQRVKRPQTVAGIVAICATVDEATAAAIWSMVTTGMGPKEYWGRWERKPHGIEIHGTKREARDRIVPDMGRCTRPAISRQAFEDRLVDAGAAITPYDCRRSFANWMETVGIIRARRRIYMGHGAKDVTDLYEWHQVLEFLATDALALRLWLEAQLAAVKQGPTLAVESGK